jgi:choline dehydrogenase-like flavoprotein
LPDRPYSGWPFGFATLAPFYERACQYCEIDVFNEDPPHDDPTARRLLEGSEFQLTEFRHSPPTMFGERFRSQLSSSDRLKLYLHANVTGIAANDSKRAVSSLDVRTLNGRKLTVTATAYVLCCGGIENARILLNCTRDFANGLGNRHDVVGRFFMDHLSACAGAIVPQIEIHDLGAFRHNGRGVSGGLMNSAETVRYPGRRGCSLRLMAVDGDPATAIAMQSPSYQAFDLIMQYLKRGSVPPDFDQHGCTALEQPRAIARALFHRLSRSFRSRAVQSTLVFIEGEQSPNPASRVTLSDEVDALGMRRAVLNWQIDPVDGRNLYQTAMELARSVGAAGIGRMIVNLEPGDELSKVATSCHHMGTTRMHDDPRQGVVDRHCAVHGLSNFYIAGSSVFPTGGRANPTLTIVALSIRLADHLKLAIN